MNYSKGRKEGTAENIGTARISSEGWMMTKKSKIKIAVSFRARTFDLKTTRF
jgi:hypothetical protein